MPSNTVRSPQQLRQLRHVDGDAPRGATQFSERLFAVALTVGGGARPALPAAYSQLRDARIPCQKPSIAKKPQ
jgi:hypothetical protein